ncbi:MAG: hypothetical protein DHS20C19_11750 [Acidimicrobiales bacterium]|nr:MAG: hypothetical protein DHS20C19_11750 [Acidimicrobiales bacterium]
MTDTSTADPGARIPFCSDEMLALHGELLQTITTNFGFVPASFRTLAYKPDLLRAVGDLSAAVMSADSVTPARLRWMVSYVSSRAAGCTYCSAHTAYNLAEVCDVDHETLDELWTFEVSDRFTPAERAALRVAVAAGGVGNVTDDQISALADHYGPEEIVELVAAISLFGFLNRWNDTLGTPLEEGPDHMVELLRGGSSPDPQEPTGSATMQAHRAGSLIFVNGQLALDAAGEIVGSGDPRAQAERCLQNIADALAAHGASLGDLVKLTCFLLDADDFPGYADAKAALLPSADVSSTTVVVRDLLIPGALLEIDAIAAAPGASASSTTGELP